MTFHPPTPEPGAVVYPPAANAGLAEAARFERDRRGESYPRLVVSGQLDADGATRDFQGWAAIAEWLATGRCSLIGLVGGVDTDPPRTLEWPDLVAAADKGLATIRRLYRDEAAFAQDPNDPQRTPLTPAQLDALQQRGAGLARICAAVARHRALRDQLNAELRARAQAERKAA